MVAEQRVGIAGAKGFGGGFEGATVAPFGEREMKAFMAHAHDEADGLRAAFDTLATMMCDVRIALTHSAPVSGTLLGERLELYAFLGSQLLAEVIDDVHADLALHGHAHGGTAHDGGGPVPIMASGGEFVIGPDEVARRGGGDLSKGHRVLDAWMVKLKKEAADTISKLPGPAK